MEKQHSNRYRTCNNVLLKKAGGDRFEAGQIFKAAQLWNPIYAKKKGDVIAKAMLDNLRYVPCIIENDIKSF